MADEMLPFVGDPSRRAVRGQILDAVKAKARLVDAAQARLNKAPGDAATRAELLALESSLLAAVDAVARRLDAEGRHSWVFRVRRDDAGLIREVDAEPLA